MKQRTFLLLALLTVMILTAVAAYPQQHTQAQQCPCGYNPANGQCKPCPKKQPTKVPPTDTPTPVISIPPNIATLVVPFPHYPTPYPTLKIPPLPPLCKAPCIHFGPWEFGGDPWEWLAGIGLIGLVLVGLIIVVRSRFGGGGGVGH